jgi:hypothetical protein
MRRKPSITTAIASFALFFSVAGTGLAASKYLITSTRAFRESPGQPVRPGQLVRLGQPVRPGRSARATFRSSLAPTRPSQTVLPPRQPQPAQRAPR